MKKKFTGALIVAAGKGVRSKSIVPKQYLHFGNKNVLEKISSNSSAIVKFDVPINWKNKGNQVFDMYAVSVETGLSNLIFFHPKRLKGKMEQALLNQSSIKSVSAMGSVLSHEIKNPLASIIGAAQLLESSNVNVVQELVDMIETQRAYEVNSKAITSVDEMLRFVSNNL